VAPEICFDESGGDGENLINATHAVYSQGSVNLTIDEAIDFVADIRNAADVRGGELKARAALKHINEQDLVDILDRHRLAEDRANIYLAEKKYFLAGKIVSLLIEEQAHQDGVVLPPEAQRAMAGLLADEGASSVGSSGWTSLLNSFNFLIKRQPRRGGKSKVGAADAFCIELNQARSHAKVPVQPLLELAWEGRHHVSAFENADDSVLRELDPTVPALAAVAATWSLRLDGAEFSILHDVHWALTAEACEIVRKAAPAMYWKPGGGVLAVLTGASDIDPRLQAADVVAGIGREVALRTVEGHTADALTEAVVPLLDISSMHSPRSPLGALLMAAELPYLRRNIGGMSVPFG
jgi:hypothetical protein